MKNLSGIVLCAMGLLAPMAKADITFVGSQAGINAFNVTLHQVSATDVKVTATLTQGAQWFAASGTGNNHPGFAFNTLSGISISNLSAPWTSSLQTNAVTNGPDLGTFAFYLDNPGNGTSLQNAGPLSFDVTRAGGILLTDFTKNAAGFFFAADIANAAGATGESGISAAPTNPVPEPSSIALLLVSVAGVGLVGKKRLKTS